MRGKERNALYDTRDAVLSGLEQIKEFPRKYFPNLLHGTGSALSVYSGILGGIHPLNNPFVGFNYAVGLMLGHQALPHPSGEMSENILRGAYEGIKSGELYKGAFTIAALVGAAITHNPSDMALSAGLTLSMIGSEIERRDMKKLLRELES